jgi:hypothetical protein
MKTPKLTDADLAEVEAFRAEIRRRPGYRLARVWIAQRQLAMLPPTHYPTGAAHVANIIEMHTGAKLEDVTIAVALEDAGVPVAGAVRYRNGDVGVEFWLDERQILDVVEQRNHGALPRPRFKLWSDDVGSLQ